MISRNLIDSSFFLTKCGHDTYHDNYDFILTSHNPRIYKGKLVN